MKHRPTQVKAVLFDFDGTLTQPGALNFPALKESIGCPADRPVLEFIEGMTDPSQRQSAWIELDTFEMAAAQTAAPNTGAEDLIRYLRTRGLRLGIISRNNRPCIERALKNFKKVTSDDFDVILTRDDPVKSNRIPRGSGRRRACWISIWIKCSWWATLSLTSRRETQPVR